MDAQRKRKVAVVLSGGGARGAYQIGALKALRQRGIVPDIYCGTSVGAFNAAMLASGKTLEEVEVLWRGLRRKDVFAELFAPRRFATLDFRVPFDTFRRSGRHLASFVADTARYGGAWWRAVDMDNQLFDMTPMKNLIRDNIDLNALHASPTQISITLTRLKPAERGSIQVVGKESLTHDHILASTALPLLFPPVAIGHEYYCDGGIVMNAPLRPAIHMGAGDIYVIDLTPPPCDYENGLLARAYQVLSAGFAATLERDMEVAADLNGQYLAAFLTDRLVNGTLEIARVRAKDGKLQPPQIHAYHYLQIYRLTPACDLGGVEQFLDFNPVVGGRMIDQAQKETEATLSGYRDEEIVSPKGMRMKLACPERKVARR